MNKSAAKLEIQRLIDKFDRLSTSEKKLYNEANTRKNFIMPLFRSLGWDVFDDFNKDEVIEEETTISGRLDYSFKLNNNTKFILEAKSISEDLDKEQWSIQAVEYGWNKGIPWVVLTDFEELKVFNSEWDVPHPRPNLDIKYCDYVNRFEDLWLLSKESFQNDELDKQAQKWGITAKREKVDKYLSRDLVKWREVLTKNFYAWNKDKEKLEVIEESVQKILDRLIFIRVVEDKALEEKLLWQAFQEWEKNDNIPQNFIEKLIPLFRRFDKDYDSNLFLKDSCEQLYTTQDPFREIIPSLYENKGAGVKYRFDAITSTTDIFGEVYEQYLGYIQGREGDKSKRKKSGIYYTPAEIVDYIVGETLKPVLDRCTSIHDLKKIKVLDPACGSGSFLIKALDVIYAKYKEFNAADGSFTKLNILTDNIYGVDLDNQAVEIARLNLLIYACDKKMKLPKLEGNVKNGNSLISGTNEELKKYFGKNYRDKKPFNWKEEFPEVFKQGGFDVIIGNPPYISYYSKQSQFNKDTGEELKFLINKSDFIKDKNKLGRFNTLMFFIESFIRLSGKQSSLGLIVDTNLHSNPSKDIREYISKKTTILTIVSEIKAFEDVASSQVILLLRNGSSPQDHKLSYKGWKDGQFYETGNKFQYEIVKDSQHSFEEPKNLSISSLLTKIKQNYTLENLVGKDHIRTCITFTGKKNFFIKEKKELAGDLPLLEGSKALPYPYTPLIPSSFVRLDTELRDKLNEEYKKLAEVENKRSPMVIGLGPIQQYSAPKVFIRLSDKRVTASFTDEVVAADLSLYILTLPNLGTESKELSILYLLTILNSRVITFYMKESNLIRNLKTGTPQIRLVDIRNIPIPKADKEIQQKLVNMAQELLDLNEMQIKIESNSNKWESIKLEIEKTDKKIDEEVYKLYGLTPKEIEIVEKI